MIQAKTAEDRNGARAAGAGAAMDRSREPPLLVALDLSPEWPVRPSCAPPWRPKAGDTGADMHYGLEFGVVASGCLYRNHGAGWFRVGVGQAWATASLEMHEWRVGPDMQYVVFQFLPSLLGQLPVLDGLDIAAPFRTPARQGVIGYGRRFRRTLAGLARELLPKYQRTVPPGQALLDMLRILHPISVEVQQRAVSAAPREGDVSAAAIAPALDRVQEATDRIVSVDEAAHACHMARRTFCRSFKAVMGISFGEYALRCRLVCAANALRTTDDPVKFIAHRFGFYGASHFHQAFSARYGVSPSQFRMASPHAAL